MVPSAGLSCHTTYEKFSWAVFAIRYAWEGESTADTLSAFYLCKGSQCVFGSCQNFLNVFVVQNFLQAPVNKSLCVAVVESSDKTESLEYELFWFITVTTFPFDWMELFFQWRWWPSFTSLFNLFRALHTYISKCFSSRTGKQSDFEVEFYNEAIQVYNSCPTSLYHRCSFATTETGAFRLCPESRWRSLQSNPHALLLQHSKPWVWNIWIWWMPRQRKQLSNFGRMSEQMCGNRPVPILFFF